MPPFSLLTRKGRARNRLSWAARWRSENRSFRKERAGIKSIKGLRSKEKATERLIQEAVAFFDADEAKQSVKDRIDEFITEHQLIRDLIHVANVEEFRLLERMERMQEKLASFQASHADLHEINDMSNELHRAFEQARSILQTEKKRAKDVLNDRQRMRDKSFLPFAMIYLKIRRKAREGKHDARHLRNLFDHVNKILGHLEKEKIDTEKLEKALRKLHKDLKKGEQEMIEEIEDLAQIEQYLTVLGFRDGIGKEEDLLEKLKETKFPEHDLEDLETKMREAYAIVEQLHEEERTETKALYKTADNAT